MKRKRNIIVGLLVVLLGLSMLGNLVRRGMMMHMAAYQQTLVQTDSQTAQTESGATADSRTAPTMPTELYRHPRGFAGHGRLDGRFAGPGSFLMIIPRLLLLGLGGLFLFKFLSHRHGHGYRPGWWRQPAEDGHPQAKPVDDLEEEIVINPDPATAPASPASSASPAPTDLTADDLLQAMKRLGIKKLEL